MLISIPSPPSANNLFFNLKGGKGRAITTTYRNWLTEAGWTLKQKRPEPFGKMLVQVALCVPNDKRRDIDNFAKPILDLLVKQQIINDDRQVERLTVERHARKDVTVSVEPFDGSISQEGRLKVAGMQ
jgi:Holliday junction resolvase RusA-like endonuclease